MDVIFIIVVTDTDKYITDWVVFWVTNQRFTMFFLEQAITNAMTVLTAYLCCCSRIKVIPLYSTMSYSNIVHSYLLHDENLPKLTKQWQ